MLRGASQVSRGNECWHCCRYEENRERCTSFRAYWCRRQRDWTRIVSTPGYCWRSPNALDQVVKRSFQDVLGHKHSLHFRSERKCGTRLRYPRAQNQEHSEITAPPKRGWVDETDMRPAGPDGSESLKMLKILFFFFFGRGPGPPHTLFESYCPVGLVVYTLCCTASNGPVGRQRSKKVR